MKIAGTILRIQKQTVASLNEALKDPTTNNIG